MGSGISGERLYGFSHASFWNLVEVLVYEPKTDSQSIGFPWQEPLG
jgi:hypothetical protein